MGAEFFFLAWFIVTFIGFCLNWHDTGYALQRIAEFRWIFVFYVMVEIIKDIQPDERIRNFLFYFAAFISLANLLIFSVDYPLWNGMRYGYGEDYIRAGGFFGNPMTFAHSFVLLLSLLIGLILLNWEKWKPTFRRLAVAVLLLCVASLLLTFTRGVWLGFAVAMSLGIFLWRPKHLPVLLFSFLICFGLLYRGSDLFKNRLQNTVSEAAGASERKILWKAHLQIFLENPVFGAGYGQNTKQLPRVYAETNIPPETLVSHAHNQYLHLAAGTGILGLVAYLLIWLFFLWTNAMLWRDLTLDSWDKGAALGLLMAQIAFLVGGLTESNFEHSKVRFMVMLVWAYVIYLAGKYKKLKLIRGV
jgi:O-antigen ligase